MDRWIVYDTCLWWRQGFNAITKVATDRAVIKATDWTAAEFVAKDWTTDDPAVATPTPTPAPTQPSLPKDDGPTPPNIGIPNPTIYTWTLPLSSSTSSKFPYKYADASYLNPFVTKATCEISVSSFDDDVRIPKVNEFLLGIDHACKGITGDRPKRYSRSFDVAPGEAVALEAWDAYPNKRGGTVTIKFSV